MSKEKFHSEDPFIPEGLEFREEYMHAALSAYKRTKRIIALKRASLLLAAVLLITGTSIALLNNSSERQTELANGTVSKTTTEKSVNPTEVQPADSNQKASSKLDLGSDEGGLHKNGQSPAVESSEPTQDLSSKAVDKGDSMSSGVGLPGQLSTPKVIKNPRDNRKLKEETSQNSTSVPSQHSFSNHNQVQSSEIARQDNEIAEDQKNDVSTIRSIPSRPIQLFEHDHTLAPVSQVQLPPHSSWCIYASAGINAWSDFAFHHSPYKLDGKAALGIGYTLNNRISTELDAHFFTVSGNASPYESVIRQYGEGFNETTYRYFTNRLYQTGVSAYLKYRLLPNHMVGIGWGTDYLLTADNRIETGVASSYENPSTSSTNEKGYVQGYRTLQHALLLNYEFALGRNKSVGAQYQWGLTDITKNEFFGNTKDKNSMLSFYFRFKLKS